LALALPAPAPRLRFRFDLSWPILIGVAAVLCVLIVLPLSWLVYFAFRDKAGGFTLANFVQLATDDTFVDPLITTVILATSSAAICCLVAAPMGWLVARTDMPMRRTVRALVTASFVTPPFLGAIAWELLAAPNSGLINQAYRAVTGAESDEYLFNIYTLPGLIFVISCYTFPYVFVLVANALDRIPGDLEDASSILGGSAWTTARRGYSVVGGRQGNPRLVALGRWKWAALAVTFIVLCNPVFLPYGALLNAAFSPVATQLVSLGTMTLHNVSFVFFELSATRLAFENTLILCTAAATIGTAMAVVIAYMTARKVIAWHKALGFLATAPVAVPGIVLGVGLFLSYTRPPLVLYGTLWILLVAFVTIALPSAYQQLHSAFRVVNPDLEEASRILGASRLGTLARITAPLLRTSVIATWCFIFVGVIRELSAAIMLFTSETKVISVLIFDLNESGDLGAIAVLGLIMLIVTFSVVVLINRIPGFGGVRLRNS
jgi:ABC-type Fe3+ transport system permease subunit